MVNAYSALYGEINNGAHRKAADLIGAPAFICHLGLWNPPESETKEARQGRKIKIDTYVQNLRALLANIDPNLQPKANTIRVGPNDRVRVITFEFLWAGTRSKIRVEIHTEYVTLTSSIDLSIDLGVSSASKPSAGGDTLRKSIGKNFGLFRAGTAREQDKPLPEFSDKQRIYDFFYRDIWEQHFFPTLLNVNNELFKIEDGIWVRGNLGGIFADFRGLATSESYPEGASNLASDFKESDIEQRKLEYLPVQQAFAKKTGTVRGKWERNSYPSADWARRRLDNVWSFLALSTDTASSQTSGRTEFTVSRLMKGRALYASALGPQPELGFAGTVRPVIFYLHSVTQCERQIGRMIDRLCQLGTLRLAAIIALPEFKKVGPDLATISTNIDATRKLIHNFVQNARSATPDQREDDERNILNELNKLQTAMFSLSRGSEDEANRELGSASLEYRLIRSRYYRELFESQIPSLRICRLEGYQPYDEFVQRRLDGAFRFIDSIRTRAEEVRALWNALDQRYLTAAVNILTYEIRELQRGEHVIQTSIKAALTRIDVLQGQSAKALTRISSTDDDLGTIQKWGEFFLKGFLLPYYASSIILHMLNCDDKSDLCSIPIGALALSMQQWVACSAFALCFVWAIWGVRDELVEKLASKLSKRRSG
jgi:hypothetical protein